MIKYFSSRSTAGSKSTSRMSTKIHWRFVIACSISPWRRSSTCFANPLASTLLCRMSVLGPSGLHVDASNIIPWHQIRTENHTTVGVEQSTCLNTLNCISFTVNSESYTLHFIFDTGNLTPYSVWYNLREEKKSSKAVPHCL